MSKIYDNLYVVGSGVGSILNIESDSNNLFVVKSNGYVGIGTANPTVKLHIDGGSNPNTNLLLKSTGVDSGIIIDSGEYPFFALRSSGQQSFSMVGLGSSTVLFRPTSGVQWRDYTNNPAFGTVGLDAPGHYSYFYHNVLFGSGGTPNARVVINSAGTQSGYSLLVNNGASSNLVYIKDNGEAGFSSNTGSNETSFVISNTGTGNSLRVDSYYGRIYMGSSPPTGGQYATLTLGHYGVQAFLNFGQDGAFGSIGPYGGQGILFVGKNSSDVSTEFLLTSEPGYYALNNNTTAYFKRNVCIGGTMDGSARLIVAGASASSSTSALKVLNVNNTQLLSIKDDGTSKFIGNLEIGTNAAYVFNGTSSIFKVTNTNGALINLFDGGGLELNNFQNNLGSDNSNQDFKSYFRHYSIMSPVNAASTSGNTYFHVTNNLSWNGAPYIRAGLNTLNTDQFTVFKVGLNLGGAAGSGTNTIVELEDNYGTYSTSDVTTYYKTGLKVILNDSFTNVGAGDAVSRGLYVDVTNADINNAIQTVGGNVIVGDNIGVGLTTPSEKIDVYGNIKAFGALVDGGTYNGIRFNSSGFSRIAISGDYKFDGAFVEGFKFWNGTYDFINYDQSGNSGDTMQMVDNFIKVKNGGLDLSAYLGVGLTNSTPTSVLQVKHGASNSLTTSFRVDNAISSAFRVAYNGNVGVGTSNPVVALHVERTGSAATMAVGSDVVSKISVDNINTGSEIALVLEAGFDRFQFANLNQPFYFSTTGSGSGAFAKITGTNGNWTFGQLGNVYSASNSAKVTINGNDDLVSGYALKVQNSSEVQLLTVDNNGGVNMRQIGHPDGTGSDILISQSGTFFSFNGGGVKNGVLSNMLVSPGDLDFNTGAGAGIKNAAHLKLATTDGLATDGGGVECFIMMPKATGNSNYNLYNFTAPSSGGAIFFTNYTDSPNRLAVVSAIGKYQLFNNTGWVMPIGTASKDLGDVDANTTASVGYNQSEVQEIADRLRDTRKVLKAVLEQLGNYVYSVTADNTTDVINFTSHGLTNNHRVKIISGTIPTGLTLNQYYFIVNKTANDFQLATGAGGAAIDFTTDGANLVLQVEYSGMNILTD
jgi:hypothetical protein